jgi:selenocysteine lyase/cysteine desulfurase
VEDPYSDRNDEIHLRHDAGARAELGCPHFAGMFALGASVDLLSSIGIQKIEERVLSLNRFLTDHLIDAGWKVLSPIGNESSRSAETLVLADDPARVVARLAEEKIIVTRKPQGIRVATHFFNNQADIERLMEGLAGVN